MLTLNECFTRLDAYQDRIPLEDLRDLLADTKLTSQDVCDHMIFCDDHYARNLLRSGPQYYALLLCWKPGQASPIHDHRGASCGVRVLEGVVTERKYQRHPAKGLEESCVNVYEAGYVCGSFDLDIHSICNEGSKNLVTLHVYSPSLTNIHIYSLKDGAVEVFTDPFAEQLQMSR